VAYYFHGTNNGSNSFVSFDFSYGGQATHGLDEGTVGVNLSALLVEVGTLLPGARCWTGPTSGFGGFYLGEEDLGSEDGAVGGTSFNYTWTVSSYCLHTHVGRALASGVACRSPHVVSSAVEAGSQGGAGSVVPARLAAAAPVAAPPRDRVEWSARSGAHSPAGPRRPNDGARQGGPTGAVISRPARWLP
jgi:hypothetical protein